MNKIIKQVLSTAVITSAISCSTTHAIDLGYDIAPEAPSINVQLNGFAHFQAGYRNQNKLESSEKSSSPYKNDLAFFNEAALVAHVSNLVNDVQYGAKIVLVTTAKRKSSNTYNGSHIYVASEYGKIELGSPITPAATMMIDAGKVRAGSGNWSRYANIAPNYQKHNDLNPTFVTSPDFFLSDKFTTTLDNRSYTNEPSRSVVFYTPKFKMADSSSIRLGIAYTPDSSNTGADNISVFGSGTETKKIQSPAIDRFEFNLGVKDAVSGAVSLEHNFSDGIDLQFAVSGEYGKAKGTAKEFTKKEDTDPASEYHLSDLKAYNIGAVLNYGSVSYAASYGSLGNSLTTPQYHKTGRKTDYYTAGIGYKQGDFALSFDYFRSEKFKNVAQAYSLGTSYKITDGFKPYFEVTRYTLDGRPEFFTDVPKKKTSGTVVITGIKLSF
ncbi:MAG TPA: hypothetical protein QKA08_03280 [Candidatus Megaira endosymbiont of Nemacystus decipiens]|nr:hypothetical protein [Candidatus Megaera endosymbiont of Nemacystus decipiens]